MILWSVSIFIILYYKYLRIITKVLDSIFINIVNNNDVFIVFLQL